MPPSAPGRTLGQQYVDARQHFDRVELARNGVRVRLTPTAFSTTYLVSIEYHPDRKPQIRVLKPQILPGAPHRYQGGTLCVYWLEWNNTMGFGTELIPWVAEWLLTYEIWQVTGMWDAPESPHRGAKR